LGREKVNIFGIYIPSQVYLNDLLEHLANYLDEISIQTYIFGDFNVDMCLRSDVSCKLNSFMEGYGLKLCNRLPTRLTDHSTTLIDHFYLNK